MSLRAGARLGPYEVVSALGAGGMGEVYRARDKRLDRDVAVKVLPEGLATDAEALARFEREAKAVAALSHPNILAIHDFGSHEGVVYAVMELLEGGTLREKVKAGPIPTKQAISLALQIVKGLEAAHEKGIIHRDLKPENIFISKDGHLKILDFGLARQTRLHGDDDANAVTEAQHTAVGVVMGTAGYMSPEQARGFPVDHRSDIFSFGAILYELLSGTKAFVRGSVADTMAAILTQEPPGLSESGLSIPPALDQIVRRCLEKSAERRFQSARDLEFALEALTFPVTAQTSPPRRLEIPRRFWQAAGILAVIAAVLTSAYFLQIREKRGQKTPVPVGQETKAKRIVVLPFENLGAPEDAYFAAGMTEEVINRLANLQGLAVISRTTAIGYERKGKTVQQIGADLGVDYVLEGTIRSEHGAGRESRVRISPQLIQVADDTHVWAGRYDRGMADIFAIQSEVAENVVSAMGVKLLPREATALKSVSTNDMEAYDLYLRGLEMSSRGQQRSDQEGALRLFQAAAERDPRFLQALVQLARTHLLIYWLHLDRTQEHVDRAREAVDRATALGPELADSHIARGYYAYYGLLDFPQALREFRATLALQPNSSEALFGVGFVLRRQGLSDESADQFKKALDLDPRNPKALWNHGETCMFARRYAEADRSFGLATSLSPKSGNVWLRKVLLQIIWRGDLEKARSLMTEAHQIPDLQDDAGFLAYLSYRLELFGRDFGAALRLLDGEKREAYSHQVRFLPVELLRGQVHALAGQPALARRSFETARRMLEERIQKQPDDPRLHSALGIACAGLGRHEEALLAVKRGVELMPASRDVLLGWWRLEDLARVHTMLGPQNEAIDQLDVVLSMTGEVSTHLLRLDPAWDPLRSNPRFQALLAKHEVKP